MKIEFREFVKEVNTLMLNEAMEVNTLGVYDSDALKVAAMLSKSLEIIGDLIIKIEDLEERVDDLEYRRDRA